MCFRPDRLMVLEQIPANTGQRNRSLGCAFRPWGVGKRIGIASLYDEDMLERKWALTNISKEEVAMAWAIGSRKYDWELLWLCTKVILSMIDKPLSAWEKLFDHKISYTPDWQSVATCTKIYFPKAQRHNIYTTAIRCLVTNSVNNSFRLCESYLPCILDYFTKWHSIKG